MLKSEDFILIFQRFLHIVDNICNETETFHNQDRKDEWSACLHLLGCALLGQADTNDESANENRVEEAIRCFFRLVLMFKTFFSADHCTKNSFLTIHVFIQNVIL